MSQPLEHQLVPYEAVKSLGRGPVLVFAPHPDDETLGCAGAIMRHLEAGDAVTVVMVTDGAFGPPAIRQAYLQTRQHEARCAASVLGYGEPIFWNLPDRGLVFEEALIDRIRASIEVEPSCLVYAPSWWEIHPDHRTLSLCVAEAIRRCRHDVALLMYEVGAPLQPNRLLDITVLHERKQAAIRCFASQLANQAYDQHIAALNRFRTYTFPAYVQFAEAYRLVTRHELLADTDWAGFRSLLGLQQALLSQMQRTQALLIAQAESSPTMLDFHAALDPGRQFCRPNGELRYPRDIDELDAIYKSTSWRITAPMRALGSYLRAWKR